MVVVIPAYEPDEKLLGVIRDFREHTDFDLVVVDDGSSAACQPVFAAVEQFEKVTLLRHASNSGKGAALKTAFAYIEAAYPRSEGVITVDADGQHLLKDALAVSEAWKTHPGALVIGSRRFKGNVPLRSRLGNSITRFVFHISTGKKVYDTQTGLRAFSVARIYEMLALSGNRYEYEINQLLYCTKNEIPILEVPIETVYIEENRSSHFHTVKDSFRIYKTILLFFSASFLSFLIDYVAYLLLLLVTGRMDLSLEWQLLISTAGARIISSVCNYLMNRYMVFDAKKARNSFSKYVLLSVFVYFAQYFLLMGATHIGIAKWIGYVIVQAIIYPCTFLIQRIFVFSEKQKQHRRICTIIKIVDLVVIVLLCALLLLNAFGVFNGTFRLEREPAEPIAEWTAPPQSEITAVPTDATAVDFLFGDMGTAVPLSVSDTPQPSENPASEPYVASIGILDPSYFDRFSMEWLDADASTEPELLSETVSRTFVMRRSYEQVAFDVCDYKVRLTPDSENGKRDVSLRVVHVYTLETENLKTISIDPEDEEFRLTDAARQNDALICLNGEPLWDEDAPNALLVRNGEVLSVGEPVSDLMVLRCDGTVKTYQANSYSVSEVLETDPYQCWSLGSILVQDAQICTDLDPFLARARSAIGYFEPGCYCFVVALGGTDLISADGSSASCSSRGMTDAELADFLHRLGAKEAYSLQRSRAATLVTEDTLFGHNGVRLTDAITILP